VLSAVVWCGYPRCGVVDRWCGVVDRWCGVVDWRCGVVDSGVVLLVVRWCC